MGAEGPSNQESNNALNYNLDRNLNPELDNFLLDKTLQSDEAKALSEIFEVNKDIRVIEVSKKNLADLRNAIKSNNIDTTINQNDKIIIDKIANEDLLKTTAIPDYNRVTTVKVDNTMSNITYNMDNYYKKNKVAHNIEKTEVGGNTVGDPVYGGPNTEYEAGKTERLAEQEYRQKYGEFSSRLGANLGLPNGIINAIIHEETDFGVGRLVNGTRVLNSDSGSKGIMQLTKTPFKDIKGDTEIQNNIDYKKIESYKKIFQKINLEELKSIDMGDGKTIVDTLKPDIWEKLSKLQDPSISNDEFISIIKDFQVLIKSKGNKYIYFHTLDIIIGSVYFSKLYKNTNGSDENKIKTASKNYNGEAGNKKVAYAKRVYNYYLDEQKT